MVILGIMTPNFKMADKTINKDEKWWMKTRGDH